MQSLAEALAVAAKLAPSAAELTTLARGLANDLGRGLRDAIEAAFSSADDPKVRDAVRDVRLVESIALVAGPLDTPTELKRLSHAELLSKSTEMQAPRAAVATVTAVTATLSPP